MLATSKCYVSSISFWLGKTFKLCCSNSKATWQYVRPVPDNHLYVKLSDKFCQMSQISHKTSQQSFLFQHKGSWWINQTQTWNGSAEKRDWRGENKWNWEPRYIRISLHGLALVEYARQILSRQRDMWQLRTIGNQLGKHFTGRVALLKYSFSLQPFSVGYIIHLKVL